MVKAVIFDLDDTLISEKQYIESGYQHISKVLGNRYGTSEQEIFQLLINLFNESPKKVFNRTLDKLGMCYSQNDIEELVDEYRNHLPTIKFFDDVLPCLKKLKKKGIKTGIITDGYANAQRQKLRAVKATDYFDEIIITDELGREFWKPHPKAFEIIRDKLKIKIQDMIYVGDNPQKDFYISSIHPVDTVRIYRDGVYRYKDYLNNIREKHSIHTLLGISEIL